MTSTPDSTTPEPSTPDAQTTSTTTSRPPAPRSAGTDQTDRPAPARKPGTEPGAKERGLKAWATRAPLLPALVFLIVVTQLPFAATLVTSLFDWNSLHPDNRAFSGLGNYATVLGDPDVRESVVTTAVLTAAVVLTSLLLGLLLALLLDRTFRGRGIVRTMLIAPFLIVPVAAALLWKHALFNPEYGLFNGLLNWFGSLFGIADPAQPEWTSEMPLLAVEAALIWQWTPFMMLIVLAGLQSRPLELIEAAHLDGANNWQVFRYLTLPHLRRYLELGALLGSIYIVQNFDAVFTITKGGLGTANLPYTIYETFYKAHEYGEASATGVLVVLGSIVIATFVLRVVSSLFSEEVSRG
ncbi:carbohydrate ABC transporter permease [Streptomyces oceani]|uniref:Sugar ABC transporter permease n=1 Tax=Streptomyces oceani TaxID=1075402 RepID=A0A1E7KK09_9ACTN|nr:sugar ABC transporter permease [Streptomyces oceani]OEV04194.1 sugar ABC transporter permease [Streptomyces oceani]